VTRYSQLNKKLKFDKKDLITYMIIFMLFGIIILFYLWHHIGVIRAGYKIEDLKEEKQQLLYEIKKLEIRKNRLLRLQRVDSIAETKLNMVKVKSKDLIIIERIN